MSPPKEPDRPDKKPRVRFAPSPTGFFHVGSARTALYNWLIARQSGGTFILRIEDSDAERGRREWVEGILDSLRWLGLDWDEGPYFQSSRSQRYSEIAQSLFDSGQAYWCDCQRQDVEIRNSQAGRPQGYDGFCRDRGLAKGPGTALRFRTNHSGQTVVADSVRGEVIFSNETIEDFVLLRSSGAPLFLLCNVVDDIDQRITFVIRGEDHLPNTPKYQLLWNALDESDPPQFAHLPMLVNEKRQKLSKRRDPVALEGYRDQGYLPQAMCNYLALLGWGPEDDQEILSKEQLLGAFSIERVNHSPAFFDLRKLAHFNGVWIRSLESEEFRKAALACVEQGDLEAQHIESETFSKAIPLIQERITTLAEVAPMVSFLFSDTVAIDQAAWAKATKDDLAERVLNQAASKYPALQSWDAASIEACTRGISEEIEKPLRRAQAPIRLAITGKPVGPPLFESMELLGRSAVMNRISAALESLADSGEE